MTQDVIYPPPEGWGDTLYIVVKPNSTQSTVPVADEISQFGDGNKRKMDETGEDRATKNPRHTLGESPQPEQTEIYTTTQPDSPYSEDHVTEMEEGPQHDLIILGLAYRVEEDELREYFEHFGEVETVEVKKDNMGQSRGFGFVRFKSSKVQQDVLNQIKHVIGGRPCEIRRSRKADHPTKLFVGHLPFFSSRETFVKDLESHFKKYGNVTDVYVPSHYRGFGFITYADGEEARRAATVSHEFHGKVLNVTVANPKKTGLDEMEDDYHHDHYSPSHRSVYDTRQQYEPPLSQLPLGPGIFHRNPLSSARVPSHTMYVTSGSSKGNPMFARSQYLGYRSTIGRPEY